MRVGTRVEVLERVDGRMQTIEGVVARVLGDGVPANVLVLFEAWTEHPFASHGMTRRVHTETQPAYFAWYGVADLRGVDALGVAA